MYTTPLTEAVNNYTCIAENTINIARQSSIEFSVRLPNAIWICNRRHYCVLRFATTKTKFTQHIPVPELCLDMDNSQLGRMMVVS